MRAIVRYSVTIGIFVVFCHVHIHQIQYANANVSRIIECDKFLSSFVALKTSVDYTNSNGYFVNVTYANV